MNPKQRDDPEDLKQGEGSSMGLESEERSVLGVRDQPHHHGGEQETEPNPPARPRAIGGS